MKTKYKLLSYIIDEKTQGYGDTPHLKINRVREISKGASNNEAVLQLAAHYGTHIDASKHFDDNGPAVTDYKINDYIFNSPLIIGCKKKKDELITPDDLKGFGSRLKKTDILLFKTGFYKYKGNSSYASHNPGMSPETAIMLRTDFANIRCVGIDAISISPYQNRDIGKKTHKELLRAGGYKSKPLIIIEDMDLSGASLRLVKIFVIPLMIKDIDGITCTVVGEYKA